MEKRFITSGPGLAILKKKTLVSTDSSLCRDIASEKQTTNKKHFAFYSTVCRFESHQCIHGHSFRIIIFIHVSFNHVWTTVLTCIQSVP